MTPSSSPGIRVAMFLYGDIDHDSRVLREARTLAAAGHRVTVLCRPTNTGATTGETSQRDGFEVVRIPIPGGWRRPWRYLGAPLRVLARLMDRARPGLGATETLQWLVIRRFAVGGWVRAAAAAAPAVDVVHGHDLTGLPAAVTAGRHLGATVIYDSHEIALASGGFARRPAWIRHRLARREQALIDETRALISVNDSIIAALRRRYRLPATTLAIHNCPPRWDPPAHPDGRLRAASGTPADARIAIYHGGFVPQRGLEELAAALLEPGLEHVHGIYLGFGRELSRVERLAADPRYNGRLHVLPAVSPDQLIPWISGADVAVIATQPGPLNHLLSTPNKLFEALAAGVPVAASDFPAIRSVVRGDPGGPLGELFDPVDPASIALAMRRILEADSATRAELRARCLMAAHDRWNWETEGARLVELYRQLATDRTK